MFNVAIIERIQEGPGVGNQRERNANWHRYSWNTTSQKRCQDSQWGEWRGSHRPWNSHCYTQQVISATGFVHGVSQSFVDLFDSLEWTMFQIMIFIWKFVVSTSLSDFKSSKESLERDILIEYTQTHACRDTRPDTFHSCVTVHFVLV